jgi:hypothetical protein
MALLNNDLLVVQRPNTRLHYKVKVEDLLSESLPDGVYTGDYLEWTGTAWAPSRVIDGSDLSMRGQEDYL